MIITTGIILLLLILDSFFMAISARHDSHSSKVFAILIMAFLIHAFIVIMGWAMETEHINNIYAIPFSFVFGPLIFFSSKPHQENKRKARIIILHSIPFFIAWVTLFYLFVIKRGDNLEAAIPSIMVLYISSAISLIIYSSLIILSPQIRKGNFDLSFIAIYFIIFALYKFYLIYSAFQTPQYNIHYKAINLNISTLTFMFFGSVILHLSATRRHKQQFTELAPRSAITIKSTTTKAKSSSENQNSIKEAIKTQNKIYDKVEKYLNSEAVRDPELDIKTVASALKLKQLEVNDAVSAIYNSTFKQALTRSRIDYACKVLESPDFDGSYENLSTGSGFKSQASFYRNFRNFKDCTPSEYRNKNFNI